jgi:hypothetical protein
MTRFDAPSFSAGQVAGSRVAAQAARRSASALLEDGRWWGRGRRRALARSLSTFAGELEAASGLPARQAAPGTA